MRRTKKEKEQQIKEIEEAFYSTYNNNNLELELEITGKADIDDIDIDTDNEICTEDENYTPAPISSPIKLVLKFSKPQEPINKEIEHVNILEDYPKEDHIDVINDEEEEAIIENDPEIEELVIEQPASLDMTEDYVHDNENE